MWLFYYSGKTTFAKSSFHFLKISIGFLFFSRNCLKLIMTTQPFRNGVHAKHQNRSFTNNKKGNATCVFRNPMYWSFSVQSHVTSAIDLETVPSIIRGNLWPIFYFWVGWFSISVLASTQFVSLNTVTSYTILHIHYNEKQLTNTPIDCTMRVAWSNECTDKLTLWFIVFFLISAVF